MKSIIIPTDFSPTAINAANYAIEFAKQMRINHMILYNAWQPLTVADPMATLVVSETHSLQESSETQLKNESDRLKVFCPIHITIETVSCLSTLANGLENMCNKNDIAYIVMGITGGGVMEEKIIGSNTISVSQSTNVPVLIVPKDCKFSPISKAMLLCDFKDTEKVFPEKLVKAFLDVAQPELEVVNFDPNFTREEDAVAFDKFYFHNMLREYAPKYKYSLRNDFEDAVNEFTQENSVQLIITISKKHSWFYKIMHPSYTTKLAFHTTVPLLVVHS